MLNAVQELTAGNAHSVTTEIPIIEHPSGDDPLIISVALKAIVLSIILAELGLTKDWMEGEGIDPVTNSLTSQILSLLCQVIST